MAPKVMPPRGISSTYIPDTTEVAADPMAGRWNRTAVMAFTCNYVVGTGFLTLPHAMVQSGLVLGVAVLVLMSLLSVVSTTCILEAMARLPPLTAIVHSRNQTIPGAALSSSGANGNNGGNGTADYGALQTDEGGPLTSYAPADSAVEDSSEPSGGALEVGLEMSEKIADSRRQSASAVLADLASREGVASVAGDGSGGGDPGAQGWLWVLPETNTPGDVRLEMPQLCLFYLGPQGRACYAVAIVMYIYASMWAYAVLVAQTFSTALPLDADPDDAIYSYWFYLVAFGVVATFLATRDITGPFMTHLSLTFSYGRVLLVVFMVATLVHAIAKAIALDDGFVGLVTADASGLDSGGKGGQHHGHTHDSSSSSSSSSHGADSDPSSTDSTLPLPYGDDVFEPSAPAPMFDVTGLLTIIPTAAFATLFHYSIPTLTAPAADKPNVGNALASTVYLVALSYVLICVPAALYFGADALPAVSLNWNTYDPNWSPALANFVRTYVVFFPALGLFSTYPLLAITLANNMSSVAPFELPPFAWRLLSSMPPILLSAFVSDLGTVSTLAGTCGLTILFVFPVALQRASVAAMDAELGPGRATTAHSTAASSSPALVAAVGLFGLAITALSAVQLAVQLLSAPLFALMHSGTSWP